MDLERTDKTFGVLVALCLILAFATAPIARLVSKEYGTWSRFPLRPDEIRGYPRFETTAPVESGTLPVLDAWGRPFRFRVAPPRSERQSAFLVYSTGPNGQDESGQGDDLVLDSTPSLFGALDVSPYVFGVFGAFLVWCWILARLVRAPRSPRLRVELARAAGIAVVPAGGVTALLLQASSRDLAVFAPLQTSLKIPPGLAAGVFVAVIAFVAALMIRVRRGLRHEDERRSPARPFPWRPALVLAGVVSIAFVASVASRARDRRERLLVGAMLGVMDPVDEVLSKDPRLARELLALPPGSVDFSQLGDATLDAIAALGSEGLPALVDSLGSADPEHVSQGYRPRAWNALLDRDRHLKRLVDAMAARPPRFAGLLLQHYRYVAAKAGRAKALELLAMLLQDRRKTYVSSNYHDVRVCDSAATAIEELRDVPESSSFLPRWKTHAGDREWDDAIDNLKSWLASAPAPSAAGWIVVHAVHVARQPQGNMSMIECSVSGGRPGGHSSQPAGEHSFALGPIAAGTQSLSVTDAASKKVLTITLAVPAEYGVFVEADFAAGTIGVPGDH
jgi:hypothetical protein